MKRYLLLGGLGVGSALVFTMGGVVPAQADNGPHMSSKQGEGAAVVIANAGATKCASCHRAHTAQAKKILIAAQPALCLTCHTAGTGAGTDVVAGSDTYSGGALRAGGFSTARIDSGAATKTMGVLDPLTGKIPTTNQVIPAAALATATTSKHNAGGTAADAGIAWGNGSLNSGVGKSVTLQCGSCHDPHGNGNYRILKPVPVDSQWVVQPAVIADPLAVPPVVAVPAVMSPLVSVKIPDAGTKQYTTTNYWLAGDTNVPPDPTKTLTGTVATGAAQPDGFIANVASWCTTCHTRYLAPTKSGSTDSTDATFKYRHRSDANYKTGAANCITCHVSHGSNAIVAGVSDVKLPDGSSAPAGDSKLLRVNNRGTCVMCHNV